MCTSAAFRLPGAEHLDEGAAAAAYVRPHDVHLSAEQNGSDARGTVERVATLGWLARVTVRLDGGETLVAHVPHDELHGASEGDQVWIDLRNPKAFVRPESAAEAEAPAASEGVPAP